MDTPYGIVRSNWSRDSESGELSLAVSVPNNAHAVILVPYDEGETVVPDDNIPEAIRNLAEEVSVGGKGAIRYTVGSGLYTFTVK